MKWSLATDTTGVPIGWVAAAANNNDCKLAAATLDTVGARGLLDDVETLHMDRGYDFAFVRAEAAERGVADVIIPKVRARSARGRRKARPVPLGLRWPIERTNSCCPTSVNSAATPTEPPDTATPSCLAITLLLTAKLIDWRNRWSPIR